MPDGGVQVLLVFWCGLCIMRAMFKLLEWPIPQKNKIDYFHDAKRVRLDVRNSVQISIGNCLVM